MRERGQGSPEPTQPYQAGDGADTHPEFVRGYQTATMLSSYAMMQSVITMIDQGATIAEVREAADEIVKPISHFIPQEMKDDLDKLRDEYYD